MSKHIHDEDDRNMQVKFRSAEDLVAEFDRVREKSRAELFREFMAEYADVEGDGRDAIVPSDDELADVYRWLLNHAKPYNGSLVVNFGDVKEDMAENFRVGKDVLKRKYLRELRQSGYIGRPTSGRFEVKPIDAEPSPPSSGSRRAIADGGGRGA